MKYKVLVADDEYIIRRGIIKLLGRFEELEVVAEAEDGEEALELANQMKPDILFVDINMPFINGLQFIEKLKDIQPESIVNIITGYDKFEYVRQALRLGVFEYILKPLNEAAFTETIHKILETMKKKQQEGRYLNWAKAALGKNKSNLIGEFLEHNIKLHYSQEKVIEEIGYFKDDLPDQYALNLVNLERLESIDLRQRWNDSLILASAENIAGEILEHKKPMIMFRSCHGYLVLILPAKSKDEHELLLQDFKIAVEKYIPVKVNLLWRIHKDCYQLHYIYQELLERMEEMKAYPSIIKKMKTYILSEYYREDISLLEVAKHVCLSPQHVSRIFKKEMGITFIDYLTQVRLSKAIELFENEELKMYEIAERVGYATQHYFSSVFKKVLGISPMEYRSQYKDIAREDLYEWSR